MSALLASRPSLASPARNPVCHRKHFLCSLYLYLADRPSLTIQETQFSQLTLFPGLHFPRLQRKECPDLTNYWRTKVCDHLCRFYAFMFLYCLYMQNRCSHKMWNLQKRCYLTRLMRLSFLCQKTIKGKEE